MHQAVRRIAVFTTVIFGLSLGIPQGSVPDHGGFPLAWLVRLLEQRPTWAHGFPALQSHAFVDRSGTAPAGATQGHGGSGRPAVKVKGGLGDYSRHDAGGKTPAKSPSIKGFNAQTSTRVPADSSATSTMWRNADGSYTRQSYTEVVNYKATDGTWQPIDTRLKKDARGRWNSSANNLKVSVRGAVGGAGGGDGMTALATDTPDDLVSMTLPSGQSVGYDLQDATFAAPTVADGTATFSQVQPNVDLEITALATKVKETLVLHSADVPTTWTYPLHLNGLTASQRQDDGAIVFSDATGTAVAEMPAGFMRDSSFDPHSGDGAYSHGVVYQLVQETDGQQAVQVSIDSAWLHDPTRVFPVVVDPTTQQISTDDDTSVIYGDDTDHSSETSLAVGTWDGGTHRARALLHFGAFNSVFNTTHISAVTMHLFQTWQYNCTSQPFWVYGITQSWNSSTARYGSSSYSGPAFGSPSLGSASDNFSSACNNTGSDRSVGGWTTVDLDPSLFNTWVTGGTNYGLGLASSSTDSTLFKRFTAQGGASSCGGHTCSPYLLVTYTLDQLPQVDSVYPPNNSAASTLTPTLVVKAHDPDNWPNKGLKYKFTIVNSAGSTVDNPAWQASNKYTVPAGKLAWNNTYVYTVQVDDSSRITPLATGYAFSTPVPQPSLTSSLAQNPDKGFDPANGNYTTSAVDASVASVGPALGVTRYYNSLDRTANSAFGLGWASILDMAARQITDAAGTLQTVSVRYPNGQEVAFGRNSDESFAPPMGRYATFERVMSGTTLTGYRLTDKDATVYLFQQAAGSGAWKITSVKDANGRTLTFAYDTGGYATTMTGASGRVLHITWNTFPNSTVKYVASVATDPASTGDATTASTWTYVYDKDRLTSVCPPLADQKCTTYGYDGVSQAYNAVLNAGPYSFWRLNDVAAGPVAHSSVLANAGLDNGQYVNVTTGVDRLPNTQSASAKFNGTSSYVQVPGKLVADGSYQSISLWFKGAAANSVLFSYSANPLTAGTTSGNYTPALYVDTNGYLRGEFWQGQANPIKSTSTVTDANWHHVVLSGAGTNQSMYLDGRFQASLSGTISMAADGGSNYEYIGAGFIGGNWPDHASTGVTNAPVSYFGGQLADVAFYNKALTQTDVTSLFNTGAYTATELKLITRPTDGKTVQVTYDQSTGNVASLIDDNGGTWTLHPATVSGNSDVYASTVLGSAPADYWRFGDTAGVDQTTGLMEVTEPENEVDGGTADYNAVTLGAAGPFTDAKAVQFDGSTSYVQLPQADIPSGSPATPASVSMWFNLPTAKASVGGVLYAYQSAPLSDTTTAGWNPALYVGVDGKLRGGFWTGAVRQITSTGTVADGHWHHVVLSAAAGSQSMYLDGALVGTITATLTSTGSTYAFVGAGHWEGAWAGHGTAAVGYWPGSISDVAYYRKALSAADAQAQFNTATATLPVAYTTVGTTPSKITMPVKTITVTDPGNNVLSYSYDMTNGNRMIAQKDSRGFTTSFGYDAGGFSNLTVDDQGVYTQTVQDARGNTIQQITCQDQSAQLCSSVYYEYYLNTSSATDPRNDQIITTRDARSGSPGSATWDSYKTTNTYDAAGNPLTVTDPLGRVTTTTYTTGTTPSPIGGTGNVPAGLPATITSPSGAVQTIEYYANGDVGRTTTPGGKVTTFAYDDLGQKIRENVFTGKFSAGRVTTFTYDKIGHVLTQGEPQITDRVSGGKHTLWTTNTYDDDGNLTQQILSDGDLNAPDPARVEKVHFDAYGRKDSDTDAEGNTTSYTYDVYGHVATETNADLAVTRYDNDPDGNVLKVTQLACKCDPNYPGTPKDVVTEQHTYDYAGRVASTTDGNGWSTLFTYTDNGLPQTVTRTDNATPTPALFQLEADEYDPAGHLTKKTSNNGLTVTTFTYDAAGRQTSSTLDSAGVNRTTTNVLNQDDQVLSMTATAGGSTTPLAYSESMYDVEGRLRAQTAYNGDPVTTPVARWLLNESSTASAAADATGNSPGHLQDMTATSWSSTSPPTGHTGYALFDQHADSHVDAHGPVFNPHESFTVTAWAKLNLLSTQEELVVSHVQPSGSTGSFTLAYSAATKAWYMGLKNAAGTWTYADTGTQAATGSWTHLAATYDAPSKTAKVYVNGSLLKTVTGVVPANDSTSDLLIGAMNKTGSNFDGSIADVQVYTHALSATQIGDIKTNVAPAAAASVTRTSYNVDNGGLVLDSTDPNGNLTSYDYDEADRQTVVTAPKVNDVRYSGGTGSAFPVSFTGYDAYGDVRESQDALNNVVVHDYDRLGREIATHLPAYTPPGSSTAIQPVASRHYDVLGQVDNSTDARGKITYFEYDGLGRVTKVTAPDGGVTQARYDIVGNQLSSTDPTGAVVTSSYDFVGHKTSTTQVETKPTTVNATTTYTFDTHGLLSQTSSPTGTTQTYTYNNAGETLTVTDAFAKTTTTSYDGLGRAWKVTNPDNTFSTTTFDQLSRPIGTASYAAGGTTPLVTTAQAYDRGGNVLSSTDGNQHTTTFTYDPTGLVLSEKQPISSTPAASIDTSFGYDLAGHATRFIDGNAHTFWTTYNSFGLPESRIEPTVGSAPVADSTYTTVYDAAGNVVSQLEPGGVTQSFGYDDNGRLTSQSGAGAEATTATRTFGYDLAGRITSFSAPTGTNTVTYDDRGLPTSIAGPSGNSSFTYDADGSMTTRTDAAGTTTYNYLHSRLDTVSNPTAGLSAKYLYNAMSAVSNINYGPTYTQDHRDLGYDDLHRLTSDTLKTSSGTQIASVAYTWDNNDNELTKTSTNFSGTTTANTYTYDFADRLTSWKVGSNTPTTYTYDKAGNRLTNGSRTFTYDERNRLVGDGSTTYHYTPRGTLSWTQTGTPITNTQSDAFDQVISQDSTSGAQTYSYDALGRALKSGFAYTGMGNDLAADASATYVRDLAGELLAEVQGGEQRLAWTDLHQDVIGQFKAANTTLDASITYDPLGKTSAPSGSMIGHLGYQSEWTEDATGRVNMLARWYNTDTGQFDSRDTASNSPVPDSISANRYQYASANPLTVTDPTGHWGLWNKIKSAGSSLVNTVKSAGSSVYNFVSNAASSVYHSASERFDRFVSWGLDKVSKAADSVGLHSVAKIADKGRKHYAQKANTEHAKAKASMAKARQAGHELVAKVTRPLKKIANKVKDAASSAVTWVKDHKDMLIEIAAIAATVTAGLLLGPVGALVAGIAINMIKDAAQGKIHSLSDLGKSFATGVVSGVLGAVTGGAGGAIAGKLLGGVAAKLGGSLVGRMASGAMSGAMAGGIGGGLTDIGMQLYNNRGTGKGVDWGEVGTSALTGAAFGGVMGGAMAARGGTPAKSEESRPADDEPTSCAVPGHSFAPDTKVAMADGSTKPIKDVKVGDKVKATDPETGKTEAKAVTRLHNNHDSDLADITVKNLQTGKSSIVHTTWHHRFWNADAHKWEEAQNLQVGSHLQDEAGNATEIVSGVKLWTGLQWMRDLTIADIHTYYVLAGERPLLVHNCNGTETAPSGQPHSTKCNCANGDAPRIVRNTGGMRGNSVTRQQDIDLQNELMDANPGWTHEAGGTRPQQVVRGPNGERRFPDLTFAVEDGSPIYFQTVDMGADGLPTMRETRNALDIEEWGGGPVVMMPKR